MLPPDVIEAFLERCRDEWADAGLPAKVTDPAVLKRIATIVATPNTAGREPGPSAQK